MTSSSTNSIDAAGLSLIAKALRLASEKHVNQRRKDAAASPYINHPIRLFELLVSVGGITDPEVLCGALLHDTVEDTQTTKAELEGLFGAVIASIVMEVTDDKSLPKAERKRQQVLHAGSISTKAKLVKLADKICNLQDVLHSPPDRWDLQRRQEYFDWAGHVVDRLRGTHPALESEFDAIFARRPTSA